MRLAVVNKCFDEEFRNEVNVRVEDIERSLGDKVKKLTETTHYDELKFDKQELKFEGQIYCNSSWCYNGLICLDLILDRSNYDREADEDGYYCRETSMGMFRTWIHPLNLETTLVTNTYSPTLAMAKLDIWAVFEKNGVLRLSPTPRCLNASLGAEYRGGFSDYIAINCLILL